MRLCYIDPPFNTGQAFEQYDDNLEHSVWLTMLRDRLVQIKSLLAPNGSVWVHLDDAEVHRCRVVLDEVFGLDNFVAEVVWQKADSTRNDAQGLSVDHDTILVYRTSAAWKPHRLPRTAQSDARFSSPDGDPRPWFDDNPSAPGAKTHQGMVYAIQHPITGELQYPARGRCWWSEQRQMLQQMSEYAPYELRDIGDAARRADLCGVPVDEVRGGVRAIMLAVPLAEARDIAQRRYEQGFWPLIVLRSGGSGGFGRKSYVPTTGLVASTWWPNTLVGHNREAKAEIKALFPGVNPFATPKPERLIKRVLEIATEPGDIVLDSFVGSGTTAAVAHKMGRRWVAVEWSADTITTFTLPRLTKVVAGEDPGGITSVETPTGEGLPDGVKAGEAKAGAKVIDAMAKAGAFDDIDSFDESALNALTKALRAAEKTTKETIWDGGGGFRVLDVGPSMFTEVDGRVYLAAWATNSALAEAVAAQLGYAYEDDAPFCGSKGRTRLAVVDGLVNDGVIHTLVSLLDDDQRLCVTGTAVDPEARHALSELRPGSVIRKVPAALLDEYRHSRSERLRLVAALNGQSKHPAGQPPEGVSAR